LIFLAYYQASLSDGDIGQQIVQELWCKNNKKQGVVQHGMLMVMILCFWDCFCLTTVQNVSRVFRMLLPLLCIKPEVHSSVHYRPGLSSV